MNETPSPLEAKTSKDDDWTDLLKQSVKLSVKDQQKLVKALAGMIGMIASYPTTPKPAKAAKGGKQPKTGQKAQPKNPLKGTKVEKDFAAAKKAVREARGPKEGKESRKVPKKLVDNLERTRNAYFTAYKAAKAKEQGNGSGSVPDPNSTKSPTGS